MPQYARVGSLPVTREEFAASPVEEGSLTGFSLVSYTSEEPIPTTLDDTENQYVAQRGGIYIQSTGASYPRTSQIQSSPIDDVYLEKGVLDACKGKETGECDPPGTVPPIDQEVDGEDQLTCMVNTLMSMIAAHIGGLDIGAILKCGSNPNPNPNSWNPGLRDLFRNTMRGYINNRFKDNANVRDFLGYLIDGDVYGYWNHPIYQRYKSRIDKFIEFRDKYKKPMEALNKLLNLDGQTVQMPVSCTTDECVQKSNPNDPNACPPDCSVPVNIRFIKGPSTPTVEPLIDALCSGSPFPIGINGNKLNGLWDRWKKQKPGVGIPGYPDEDKIPKPALPYPVFPSDPRNGWIGEDGDRYSHQVTVVDFTCRDGKLWLKVQDSFIDPDTGKPRVFVIEMDPKDFSNFNKIVKPGIPIDGLANGLNILGVEVYPKYTPEQIAEWCENNCNKPIIACTPSFTVVPPTPTPSTSSPLPTPTPSTSAPAPSTTPTSTPAAPVPTPSSSSGGSMPTPSISSGV